MIEGVVKDLIFDGAEQIKSMFKANVDVDRNLIKEGLALYRHGNVYNVTQDGAFVEGKVLDGITYDTNLDLASLEDSFCECATNGFCIHQLGLFFYVYASVDRIGVFMDDWKNSEVPFSHLGLRKKNSVHKQYEEKSLPSWLTFFENRYDAFKRERNPYDVYVSSTIYHRYFWSLRNEAPKVRELKGLFIIHAALTAFLKMADQPNALDTYVKSYMQQLIDVIREELIPLRSSILPFSLDSLVGESVERIREVLLVDDEFQYERVLMYETFWSATFPQKVLREAEKRKLAKNSSQMYQLALCHLKFLERDDVGAISLFETLTPMPLHFCFDWMKMLMEGNQEQRFSVWSEFATAHIKEYVHLLPDFHVKRNITRYFLQLVEEAENYSEALDALMPYSAYEYSEHLFHARDFRRWVELQLLLHAEVNNFDRHKLKMIEDEDKACLLPLYHFSITKALNERNRQSYKQAVRYLKKLRTHYKKLKRQRQWEIYLARLVAENKRLRAFMEELQKGKLIDA